MDINCKVARVPHVDALLNLAIVSQGKFVLMGSVKTLAVKARFVYHQKPNVAMEFVDVHRVLQIPILILLHVNVNQLIHVVDVQQEEPV